MRFIPGLLMVSAFGAFAALVIHGFKEDIRRSLERTVVHTGEISTISSVTKEEFVPDQHKRRDFRTSETDISYKRMVSDVTSVEFVDETKVSFPFKADTLYGRGTFVRVVENGHGKRWLELAA